MRIIVCLLLITLLSCNTHTEYRLHIFKGPPVKANRKFEDVSAYISEDIKKFDNTNDTLAFKSSIQQYWIQKIIAQEMNAQNEKEGNTTEVDEPFLFVLYKMEDNDSLKIEFDSAYATNLAKPIIDSLKVQIPKFLHKDDSAVEKPKPNIY